ncbi:MAG: phosphoribosyl-dephospho-CoA transferase [Salinisphaera sp.]|nr:phosphoribosyl-dephospho-CoA transferase [Salinisphaera sp.]
MERRLKLSASGNYSEGGAGRYVVRPHDLLWCAEQSVGADAPAWANPLIARGGPFVVRRAPRASDCLPVGVRGLARHQRFAMTIAADQVMKTVTPEQCAARIERPTAKRRQAIPALDALPALAATLDSRRLCWGVTGAVGYELATDEASCHAASDIDVLIRLPQRLTRRDAAGVVASLAMLPVRCDIQMETPLGGVALADWAAGNDNVLVKSDQGPFLCADPWVRSVAHERASRSAAG